MNFIDRVEEDRVVRVFVLPKKIKVRSDNSFLRKEIMDTLDKLYNDLFTGSWKETDITKIVCGCITRKTGKVSNDTMERSLKKRNSINDEDIQTGIKHEYNDGELIGKLDKCYPKVAISLGCTFSTTYVVILEYK